MQFLPGVSGAAVSTGFGSLQMVGGRVTMQQVGWGRPWGRTALVLPELRSTGGLWIREMYSTSFSCPVLARVDGVFYWFNLPSVRTLHFESLRSVTGAMSFSNMGVLANLCAIGVPRSGYTSNQTVVIDHMGTLRQAPGWLASSAALPGLAPCTPSGGLGVVIITATDYARFVQNSAVVNAEALGTVVLAWAAMSDAQVEVVLRGRRWLGGLAIEGLDDVTTVTCNATVIGSALILDDNARLATVSFPRVVSVGSSLIITRSPAVTQTMFSSLQTVNGSLTMQFLPGVSGAAVSTGFGSLQMVGGRVTMQQVGWGRPWGRTALVLPELRSTGGLWIREMYSTSFSCPVLARVDGVFYWFNLPLLSNLSFAALQYMSGQLLLENMDRLASLCSIGLDARGYHSNETVRVVRLRRLAEAPAWLLRYTSPNTVTPCSSSAPTISVMTPAPTATPTSLPSLAPSRTPSTVSPTFAPSATLATPTVSPLTSTPSTLAPTAATPWQLSRPTTSPSAEDFTQGPSNAPSPHIHAPTRTPIRMTMLPTSAPTLPPLAGSVPPTLAPIATLTVPTFAPLAPPPAPLTVFPTAPTLFMPPSFGPQAAPSEPVQMSPTRAPSSATVQGRAGDGNGDGSATLLVAVVLLLVCCTILIVAVAWRWRPPKWRRATSHGAKGSAFDNPLYESSGCEPSAVSHDDDDPYEELPVADIEGAYAEILGDAEGYMDVTAGTVHVNGYMDVAPCVPVPHSDDADLDEVCTADEGAGYADIGLGLENESDDV